MLGWTFSFYLPANLDILRHTNRMKQHQELTTIFSLRVRNWEVWISSGCAEGAFEVLVDSIMQSQRRSDSVTRRMLKRLLMFEQKSSPPSPMLTTVWIKDSIVCARTHVEWVKPCVFITAIAGSLLSARRVE